VTEQETISFIQTSIRSVWALEVLLFLRRNGQRCWWVEEIIRELRSSQTIVVSALGLLEALGLIVKDPDGSFQYRRASESLASISDQVAEIYAARPTAVIQAIASAPNQNLRMFSDAFKLKE
jgi:hypothetical protein